MVATVQSATLLGVEGLHVAVEVHVANGLPGYTVVGLPDTAGRESRERVRAAMQSSDIAWPNKRITANLSPATVRKTGAGLELAIALALMLGEDELPAGEIAQHFDVTRPAVSQHLTVLKDAGLLTERRDGTRRLYRARPEGLEDLREFLDEFWGASLERLKWAAESEHRRAR